MDSWGRVPSSSCDGDLTLVLPFLPLRLPGHQLVSVLRGALTVGPMLTWDSPLSGLELLHPGAWAPSSLIIEGGWGCFSSLDPRRYISHPKILPFCAPGCRVQAWGPTAVIISSSERTQNLFLKCNWRNISPDDWGQISRKQHNYEEWFY